MSSPSPEFEARQLSLPKPIHTLSPRITSLLYDRHSQSLALRHIDSSFSLYSSAPPLSLSAIPSSSQMLVPSPTSSATFVHLQTANLTATLFLTSSPLLRPSADTLFRFYLFQRANDRFSRIRVVSNHGDLEFDEKKFGVVFKVNHGVSVKLSGGVNVFSMYSVSNLKIWVFAVRLVGDNGDGGALKLMKCAVIDCGSPIFTMRVLSGYLILGEENGVRVFPLRPLVKGKVRKERRVTKRLNLHNGLINGVDAANCTNIVRGKFSFSEEDLNLVSSKSEKSEKRHDTVKMRSVKLRQDSRDSGACFVAFKGNDIESSLVKMGGKSAKAISIQALSANKFLILDSVGDLHLLCLSYSARGLETPCHMKLLTRTMKVTKLAILHDVQSVEQTVWISDGHHTVHRMVISGMDNSADEIENKDSEAKLIQTSVTQAIFTSEKIQEMLPLAANAMLILGQGNLSSWKSLELQLSTMSNGACIPPDAELLKKSHQWISSPLDNRMVVCCPDADQVFSWCLIKLLMLYGRFQICGG